MTAEDGKTRMTLQCETQEQAPRWLNKEAARVDLRYETVQSGGTIRALAGILKTCMQQAMRPHQKTYLILKIGYSTTSLASKHGR